MFSAKEAVFKALYPLLGVEIDFLEAHAELEPSRERQGPQRRRLPRQSATAE